MTANATARKVFISYAWSTAEHDQFVEDLATDLRNNGVDAIVDKWRLKPGQDKYVFMESMVTDQSIVKVLVLCDQRYQQKADERSGGVGTESQIISNELYSQVNQEKFIPIICERGPAGEEYVPVFMKNRIYVDMSSPELYGDSLDKLLRLIYEKPLNPEPALGQPPAFLVQEGAGAGLPTARELPAALRAIREGRPNREGLETLFTRSVFTELQRLYTQPESSVSGYDEEIYQAILKTKGLRDQLSDYLETLASFGGDDPKSIKPVVRMLELIGHQFGPPERPGGYSTVWADHYRFFALETCLLMTAALLRHERWSALRQFLKQWFLVRVDSVGLRPHSVSIFDSYIESMDEHRNNRLRLNRAMLTADLLKERSGPEHTPFSEICQADAFLALNSAVNMLSSGDSGIVDYWRPRTGVYGQDLRDRPMFLRAIDPEVRAGIWKALGVASGTELAQRMEAARSGTDDFKIFAPRRGRSSFLEGINLSTLVKDK